MNAGRTSSLRLSRFDRRILERVPSLRSWLALSVAIGVSLTACLVAQALFLGPLLARVFQRHLDPRALAPDLLGLLAASALRSMLLLFGKIAGTKAANSVRSSLRDEAAGAVLALGPQWLADERAAELAISLGYGLDAIDVYVGEYLPELLLAVLTPLVILVSIAIVDWLSFLVLIVALAVLPLFMVLVGRLTEDRIGRRWSALVALGAQFLDAVEGLATLRAYGRARYQEQQIAHVTDELRRTTLAVLKEAFLSALVLETLAAVGTALVAVPLALRLLSGKIALWRALSVLVLTPEVFLPLRRASADFHASAEGISAVDRVLEVIEHGSAAEGHRPAIVAPKASGPRPPRSDPAQLTISGVSISMGSRREAVVEGANLEILPGERVALVGPSGAGKSTLIGAIIGLVSLDAGSIILGGVALDQADPRWWKAQFAYLPQRPQLFGGTLEENLLLGAADASNDEIAEVLDAVELSELIRRLPEGIGTNLGEQAERLSTGERQRLALARALLRRDSQVLLLDEPTAHLDLESESSVIGNLARLLGKRSLLVATHRRAVLSLADRVVILSDGRLADSRECESSLTSKRFEPNLRSRATYETLVPFAPRISP